MKHKIFISLFVFLFFTAIGRSQTIPEGKVQTPENHIPVRINSPLDLHIILDSNKITAKFSNLSHKILDLKQLDNFIKDKNIVKDSPHVYIEATRKTSRERIKKVFKILENNNIKNFYFQTK